MKRAIALPLAGLGFLLAAMVVFWGGDKSEPNVETIHFFEKNISADKPGTIVQEKDVELSQDLTMPDEYDGSIPVAAKKEHSHAGPIHVQAGEGGPEDPDADHFFRNEYKDTPSGNLNAPEVDHLPNAEMSSGLAANIDHVVEVPDNEALISPRYESSDNVYPEAGPEVDAQEN